MTDLAMILGLINYVFVLFFGIVVSLYLADINFMDHKVLYFCTLLGFGAAEGIFYLFMGESLLYKCYPLLIHVPLILLIWLVFHRNFYVSTIAVLSAYLLCTPRKWLGTLFLSRKSAHCQHNRNLCNDSFTFSGRSLYCTIHYPSEI